MSGLFPEGGSARIGRRVAEVLRADSFLTAIFGGNIGDADYPQLERAIKPLQLDVVPGVPKRVRVPGGDLVLAVPVQVIASFPRTTPAVRSITPPPAPVLTAAGAPGTGALTGTYTVRHTRIEGSPWAAAESYASEPAVITLDRQNVTVTPGGDVTSALALRVWRSVAGLKACRWAGTAIPAGAYEDGTPDARLGDELAPDLCLERNLQEYLSRVLFNAEELREGDELVADAALDVQFGPDGTSGDTNLRTVSVIATYPSLEDAATGAIVVGGAS